jgi:periplasmic protein TonB
MTAKLHERLLDSSDLRGLPGARLRALLLAIFPDACAPSFDAQLADLLAEWAEVRESRGRLRAAWLAAGIRVHLLIGAILLTALLLAPRGLRGGAQLAFGLVVTSMVFAAIAHLIEAQPGWAPFLPLPKPWPLPERVVERPLPHPELWKKPTPPSLGGPGGKGLLALPLPDWRPTPPGDWNADLPIDPPSHLDAPAVEAPGLDELATDACLPLVRLEPDYPPRALARGVEGYVRVEMDIDASGSVRDPRVVSASPTGVFDAAVIRAVRRWRYRPATSSTASSACSRTQVMLRFEVPGSAR